MLGVPGIQDYPAPSSIRETEFRWHVGIRFAQIANEERLRDDSRKIGFLVAAETGPGQNSKVRPT